MAAESNKREDKFECAHEGRCQFECVICMPNGDCVRCKHINTDTCEDCIWEREEIDDPYSGRVFIGSARCIATRAAEEAPLVIASSALPDIPRGEIMRGKYGDRRNGPSKDTGNAGTACTDSFSKLNL